MGGSSSVTRKGVGFFAGEIFGEVVARGRVWFGLSRSHTPPFPPSLSAAPGGAALCGRAPPNPSPRAGVTPGLRGGGGFYVIFFFFLANISKCIRI